MCPLGHSAAARQLESFWFHFKIRTECGGKSVRSHRVLSLVLQAFISVTGFKTGECTVGAIATACSEWETTTTTTVEASAEASMWRLPPDDHLVRIPYSLEIDDSIPPHMPQPMHMAEQTAADMIISGQVRRSVWKILCDCRGSA